MCVSTCQVSVPKDLVAVMSAMRDGQEVDPQDNSRVVFRFRQPVSVCVLRADSESSCKQLVLMMEADIDRYIYEPYLL